MPTGRSIHFQRDGKLCVCVCARRGVRLGLLGYAPLKFRASADGGGP